ncbi:MAG: hypothetical protein QXL82_03390 [Candidatus Aenigmatarchaeota archaeon]
MEEQITLTFNARIVEINNKYYLRIEADLSDKDLIKKITKNIIKNGYQKINAIIIFKNPVLAVSKLKEADLL